MPEKPLLLPSAKSGILIAPGPQARLRLAALAVGACVVLVGAADLTTRLAHAALGPSAGALAFAPAIALTDPSVLAAATSTGLVPARLRIPSLGVDAPVEQVAAKADGTMDTPKKFGDVAWYAPGARPGNPGNAVIAGHVDNALTTSGVFEHLDQISIGDYITVADEAGKTLVYRVISNTAYPVDEAPAQAIFATEGPSRLVLITCTGQWEPGQRQYSERLVVVAAPAY